MKESMAKVYLCPETGDFMKLLIDEHVNNEIISGMLVTESGNNYRIINGIPHLLHDKSSESRELESNKQYYETVGKIYDEGMEWLFESMREDENSIRKKMIKALELKPGYKVLETGCGTCRGTNYILDSLEDNGEIFAVDLSPQMLEAGRLRMKKSGVSNQLIEYLVADAGHLPFPDDYFDAAFHFGGINLFHDPEKALREMCRVVNPGGKIVFGDEGLAPWLLNTQYGEILLNSNPLYSHKVPLGILPIVAREVCIRWIIGNAFYLIDFRVGTGVPDLNLDLTIPGKRGGTHRTRFFGKLDGVTPDTKKLAEKAAEKAGKSLSEWLDTLIRDNAQSQIDDTK